MHKELSDLQRVQIQLLDGGVDREPLGEHELGVDPVHGCNLGVKGGHRWSQVVTRGSQVTSPPTKLQEMIQRSQSQ